MNTRSVLFAIAFPMLMLIPTSKPVYAQAEMALDVIPAIIAGVKKAELTKVATYSCKNVFSQTLDCRSANGYIDNFYVIFIDKDLIPAKTPLLVLVGGSSIFDPALTKKHCSASRLEYEVVGESDVPTELRGNVPAGKQAVYHRIRVHNGKGRLDVTLRQPCVRQN